MTESKTETTEHHCAEKVYSPGVFSGYGCSKKAKYEEDGKWYCGIHAPSRAKARQDVKRAEREAERAERERIWTRNERRAERIAAKLGVGVAFDSWRCHFVLTEPEKILGDDWGDQ